MRRSWHRTWSPARGPVLLGEHRLDLSRRGVSAYGHAFRATRRPVPVGSGAGLPAPQLLRPGRPDPDPGRDDPAYGDPEGHGAPAAPRAARAGHARRPARRLPAPAGGPSR